MPLDLDAVGLGRLRMAVPSASVKISVLVAPTRATVNCMVSLANPSTVSLRL